MTDTLHDRIRAAVAATRTVAEDVASRKIGKQLWIPVGNGIAAATLNDTATRLVAVEVMGSDLQELLAAWGHPTTALRLCDHADRILDRHPAADHHGCCCGDFDRRESKLPTQCLEVRDLAKAWGVQP